ncbi:MAG TPA: TonB-dependent receptor, partial [Longimicrobiaceae bacterium]|nr:TonB-dependent receptor [Longimicrobiaceae bacterium]
PPLGALRDWGARLGATASLGAEASLHAGVSRRARFPSLREAYSGALGRFEPNPALRPETLLAAEAGATAQLGALQLQAVGFHHRLRDAIVRAAAGDGRFRRENRDEVRSTGAEYQPALAGAVDGSTAFPLGLRAEAGVRFQGRQWCVHPELGREVALAATARADLRLSRAWRGFRAGLALDNAADAAVYDQCGLPQPGRTLRLELRAG